MTAANQLAGYASSLPNFRNRIINGDMRIDQRNAGSSLTANAADEYYAVDRFSGFGVASAGVYTLQQVSDSPDDFDYSLKVTVTNPDTSIPASGRYLVRTKLEGNSICGLNFGSSAAKNITLSFYVKSSLTGTFGGTFINGAQDRSYPFSYTIAPSSVNTWERKTITLTADTTGTWPTDNTKALQIGWSLGVGSDYLGTANSWVGSQKWGVTGETNVIANNSATWQITGVQLEEGTVATPFEHRPVGVELSLCQRYYATSIPNGYTITDFPTGADGAHMIASGSNDLFGYVPFPLEMRAAPTTYIYSSTNRASGKVRNGATGTDHTISSYQPQSNNNKNLVYFSGVTSATSAGQHFTSHYVASAEL